MKVEYSLKQIASVTGGQLFGDSEKRIRGVAPFDTAGPDQITFAGGSKYLKKITEIGAGAIIVPKAFGSHSDANLIAIEKPCLLLKFYLFFPPKYKVFSIGKPQLWKLSSIRYSYKSQNSNPE